MLSIIKEILNFQILLFSVKEIIDIVIICLALGFIFQGYFKPPKKASAYDPVHEFRHKNRWINWEDFKFSIYITAPSIILHEFGHKFMAIGFGTTATFNAYYPFLGLGVIMKLVNFGFIFFVPAYVSFLTIGLSNIQISLIAFAGPFVNLMLWIIPLILLRTTKFSKNVTYFLHLTKFINMFLFIFNMLPIPGFDGFQVFSGLLHLIF